MNKRFQLKADLVLSQIAEDEALAQKVAAADDLVLPVTIRNVQVGLGRLRPDGSFTADIFGGPEGRELREKFIAGTALTIALSPNPIRLIPSNTQGA